MGPTSPSGRCKTISFDSVKDYSLGLPLLLQPEDPSPTAPMRIKTTILEICELYTQRYNELSAPRLPVFVRGVWELIGTSTPAVREDGIVSQAIHFLSVSAKTGSHVGLFGQQETLQALCEHIVVPSMVLRGSLRKVFHYVNHLSHRDLI